MQLGRKRKYGKLELLDVQEEVMEVQEETVFTPM